ncbi:MAG: hypothetical protein NT075_14270 [Chloroflexi bacterium]|nr:hypothetical protein [Chloroflexota bacterium]
MLLRKPSPSAAAKTIYGLALIPHAAGPLAGIGFMGWRQFFLGG